MSLTRSEIGKRHRLKYPEKYTADARRSSRKTSDIAYRKTEAYRTAYTKYRASEGYQKNSKDYHLLSCYGLTFEDKKHKYEEQKGLCGLCSKELPSDLSKCDVDHNHATHRVRELLHRRCNLLVGFFEKDPELPCKVEGYLKRYE